MPCTVHALVGGDKHGPCHVHALDGGTSTRCVRTPCDACARYSPDAGSGCACYSPEQVAAHEETQAGQVGKGVEVEPLVPKAANSCHANARTQQLCRQSSPLFALPSKVRRQAGQVVRVRKTAALHLHAVAAAARAGICSEHRVLGCPMWVPSTRVSPVSVPGSLHPHGLSPNVTSLLL